jgi:cytosine/adenosine deaminase-related metal-dependent hydrolase
MQFEGTIVRGESYEPVEGRVVVEDGRIAAVEEESVDSEDVICPAFVNGHTHIGDAVAKDAGATMDPVSRLYPPDGLKFEVLEEASHEEHVDALHRAARYMQSTGTAAYMDFREGGIEGVQVLREATDDLDVRTMIFGRDTLDVLDNGADGYGPPFAGVYTPEVSRETREEVRDRGALFGTHAGEGDSSDIDVALDLDPDFLVHMVHPEDRHLDRIEDEQVPIVSCPRGNHVNQVGRVPLEEYHERTKVALGTDNVMLTNPSMLREMDFAAKLTGLPPEDILRMATRNGAEIAGMNCGVIEEGYDAKLVVFDGTTDNMAYSENVVASIVHRADLADVKEVHL